MAECFDTSQNASNPVNLCICMTVLDRQTGKMALVWQSRKETKDMLREISESFHCVIKCCQWMRLHRQRPTGVSSSSTDEGLNEIKAYVGCHLGPLPDQEDVDPMEKKYEAAAPLDGPFSCGLLY